MTVNWLTSSMWFYNEPTYKYHVIDIFVQQYVYPEDIMS